MTVIPATMTVKVAPFQTLQYDGAIHTAGENGILSDMPYDTARLFIANGIAVAHDEVGANMSIVRETDDIIEVFIPDDGDAFVDANGNPVHDVSDVLSGIANGASQIDGKPEARTEPEPVKEPASTVAE